MAQEMKREQEEESSAQKEKSHEVGVSDNELKSHTLVNHSEKKKHHSHHHHHSHA
jgi:hypothetical protein